MKFESTIGIGEICGYNEDASRGSKRMDDVLVRVVAICFVDDGRVEYHVEHIGQSFGVQRFATSANRLHGDPEFNQEAGNYPAES